MSGSEPPQSPPPPSPPPPPPPPPGGQYGGPPPPAAQPAWSVGAAVSYGWEKFQKNAGQIIVAGLVVFVGIALLQGVAFVIRAVLTTDPECTVTDGVLRCTDGSGFFVYLIASAISSVFFFLVYQIIGAGIIRGSLGITEGRPFEFTSFFSSDKLAPVVVTSLISSAIIFVGTLLCVLPGIIASFALSYALYFVIDQGMSPMQAIMASVTLVKDNVGTALVWAIVGFLLAAVGAIACLVGLIVTIPVSIIGTAYTYKVLTNQAVVA